MNYEVYYNMMGVLPVRNFFSNKDDAEKFMEDVKAKGFEPELIER